MDQQIQTETQIQTESGKLTLSQRLSLALRWIGVGSIVGSGTVFMLQGLHAMSSFERFLSVAGLTGALAALGLYMGTRLKEGKTARTFLGLAAAATPVVFSQLGAMLYTAVSGPSLSPIPTAFQVAAPSMLGIWIALLLTFVVLTPILYIGFGSLFRSKASDLALILIGFSALLLLPTRNADWTAVLLLMQAISFFVFVRLSKKVTSGRVETVTAVLLPLTPAVIMTCRQLYYSSSDFLFSSVMILLAGFFIQTLPALVLQEEESRRSRQYGFLFLAGAWMTFVSGVLDLFPISNGIANLLIFYPPAICLQLFSSNQNGKSSSLVQLAQIFSFAVPVLSLTENWDVGLALAHVLIGFLFAGLGFSFRRQLAFASGLLTGILGMLYLLSNSVVYLSQAPWISLAVAGIGFILLAGWLEKNKSKLAEWRVGYQQHFRETSVPSAVIEKQNFN